MRSRHIDIDARMIWQSVRNQRHAMTAAQVRAYWSPTFSDHQVVDALQRLVAGRHLKAAQQPTHEHIYFLTEDCVPLPGFAATATRPPVGVVVQ